MFASSATLISPCWAPPSMVKSRGPAPVPFTKTKHLPRVTLTFFATSVHSLSHILPCSSWDIPSACAAAARPELGLKTYTPAHGSSCMHLHATALLPATGLVLSYGTDM